MANSQVIEKIEENSTLKTPGNFAAPQMSEIQRACQQSQLAFLQEDANGAIQTLFSPNEAKLALIRTPTHLALRKLDEPKLGDVVVDFLSGALTHRRKFGGGRGEAIAKAAGIKGDYLPDVIDATAGLGRDAFVLAAIGCRVRLIERHPIVRLLLQDGLFRAYCDPQMGAYWAQHLQLLNCVDLRQLSPKIDATDVIYLDPMFPHKAKSALVKKEMRVFQHLVGADLDAPDFLPIARQLARKRVIVKRPDYAPPLGDYAVNFTLATKNHRFDIYLGENRP